MTWRFRPGLLLRLALTNALVFSVGAGLVIFSITSLSLKYLQGHLDESVTAELEILESDYVIDGLTGVVGLIRERDRLESAWHGRIYRLETPDGQVLAGDFPHWPEALDIGAGPIATSAQITPGAPITEWMMAARLLPGGERLLVGFDRTETLALSSQIRRAAGWSIPLAVLLAVIGSIAANRTAARQIRTIDASARRIVEGDLRHRIPLQGSGDELDRLTQTLNTMLDRINDLIAATRGATDAIAHDLRTPLARLRVALEDAQPHPPSADQWHPWLQDRVDDIDRVLGSFSALLQLATVESGVLRTQFQSVGLATVVSDVVSLYEAVAADADCTLRFSAVEGNTPIMGDRHLLFQAIANLLDNALKFTPKGGQIQIRLTREGSHLQLEVEDSGPGIPTGDEERVFERLFRHDHARQSAGFGLGLSLVRAIARLHDGDCVVVPKAQGALLRIRLPVAQRNSQR